MLRDDAVIRYVDVERNARRVRPAILFAQTRKPLRLFALMIGAASLAACAQSSVVSQRSQALASRSAPDQPTHAASSPTRTRVAAARIHRPYASHKTVETKIASQGVASFYSDQQETASGEKFDGHELTAAHPTLPFGTRLRVTDVNDRGPYVPGRIVDVSYSAAQSLGMIGKGVANVRLDVVQ